MKLSRVKAAVAVGVTTLASFSPAWAQIICDRPGCNGDGGGGDPQLAAPAVIALVAVGIVTAMIMARRK